MKKDEIILKKCLDKYRLKSSELTEGMYVGRINFKAGRIDNKYIVVNKKKIITNDNDFSRVITCYDFIENKLVDFKAPLFSFLKGSEDNDDFYYKFKYSSHNYFKQLKVGDKVVFINPENIKTRPTPLFKIVKKQIKQGDCGRFDLMDGNGYVIHNVPGILLLKEVRSKEEIKMEKDELFTKFEDYVLNPSDLHVGMFVGKINFRKKIIENKYIITSIRKNNEIIIEIECFDFVKDNEVTFDGLNIFTFLKVDLYNKDDFQYKYKYSSHNYFKQLKVGDEVEFIQPIDSPISPHWVFKIIEKTEVGKLTDGHVTLESRLGLKIYSVPGILLTDTYEEKINNKFNSATGGGLLQMIDKNVEKNKKKSNVFSAEDLLGRMLEFKPKTPSKLKFSVDIDYSDDTPIEILFKDGNNSSYSRKALMYDVPLDKKIEISNTLKDVFKKIFYNED